MIEKKPTQYNKGAAILITVIFFLFISMTVVFGMALPILKQVKASSELIRSKKSYYTSMSSLEDVVLRIKNLKQVSPSESISLNGGSATTITSSTVSGKQVISTGNINNNIRKTQTDLIKGTGVIFKYGSQAGQGGIEFKNNAYLDGSLYSNGNIIGANGAYITGDAFVAGASGLISNMKIGYGGTGDARAHTVTGSTVTGTIYCQSGSGNNKSCNTSQADPNPEDMPISQEEIDTWKIDASNGGVTNGDVTISGSTSIGPRKIVGNLTINGTMTILNTIWVTGNVLINGTVKLDTSYGTSSGIIIADGYIDISNGVVFQDSGSTGSYIMLLSTSSCESSISGSPCFGNDAIMVDNNSNVIIVNAQNGTVYFKNNSSVKEIVAKKIVLKNNVGVIYGSGVANVNFTSGPSGAWVISGLKETQ